MSTQNTEAPKALHDESRFSGPERRETINGRELRVRDLDMNQYPNVREMSPQMAEAYGPRGATGLLYTRKNGTRWILWIPSGRMGQPRTEEVR